MDNRTFGVMIATCAMLILSGCSSTPYHPNLVNGSSPLCRLNSNAGVEIDCATVTPEISTLHELHFVEFDDQGWLFDSKGNEKDNVLSEENPVSCSHSDPSTKDGSGCEKPKTQIDHLMERLTYLIANEKEDLSIILYVHGWKHNAETNDSDVRKFRQLIAAMERIEDAEANPRKVVGIYVGWHGKSWLLPGITQNLSFWSRKNAALRVSNNSAKELFARLRAVQRFYNDKSISKGCASDNPSHLKGERCKIRTLMVGHSFGAWILYSAVSGPMIASLSARHDLKLPQDQLEKLPVEDAERVSDMLHREKAERVADMVVLINPAFEGSRYESLHHAAKLYSPQSYEPPMLVTITSKADWATKNTFPIGRFFNTLVEFPITSETQKLAMRRTPGNIDAYLTHELSAVKKEQDTNPFCSSWIWPAEEENKVRTGPDIRHNKKVEQSNDSAFFQSKYLQKGMLTDNWERKFCGGVTLKHATNLKNIDNRPNSVVWNIRTDESLIGDHNDIMRDQFLDFVRQLYADTLPRNYLPTEKSYVYKK